MGLNSVLTRAKILIFALSAWVALCPKSFAAGEICEPLPSSTATEVCYDLGGKGADKIQIKKKGETPVTIFSGTLAAVTTRQHAAQFEKHGIRPMLGDTDADFLVFCTDDGKGYQIRSDGGISKPFGYGPDHGSKMSENIHGLEVHGFPD